MRGAWVVAMPILVGTSPLLAVTKDAATRFSVDADALAPSGYVSRLTRGEESLPGHLLPVQGIQLPVVSAIDSRSTDASDTQLRSPQVPAPVEAIPTPTAFQAGAVVLATIGCSRLLRRMARS